MSTGGPTRCFTLDITHGSYLLTQPALSIPEETAEFSINMSNQRFWRDGCKKYIEDLMQGEQGVRAKRFNMRWNGAMVGDVHRVLQRGGVFLYPNDSRNPKQPSKLRLLYEANPMAMLVKHAGGLSIAEGKDILTLQPESLHQRVEVVLGSKQEVEAYLSY
jgi:fructose-1,6-bisphosphatase I